MEKFCAIYFSGTGNTKFCVTKLVKMLDEAAPIVALEDGVSAVGAYENIVLGYSVQFSNIPKIVREFILRNKAMWSGKNVLCVATMGAFSGDGAGCAARLLKRCGASVSGGLHLKMPDSVCDSKLLKRSNTENIQIIRRAEEKIERAALRIKRGKFPRDGLSFFAHLMGLFGQRLWFCNKAKHACDKWKVDKARCVACGNCVRVCPTHNLTLENGVLSPHGNCTMCYRCISLCPQAAITLLGERVVQQYRAENFTDRRE